MKNISRIQDLAKETNNQAFWDSAYKKAKSFFEDEGNRESLHYLISSENNLDYLNLAKKLNIKVPTEIILSSLKHKSNLSCDNYAVLFKMHEKSLLKNLDIVKEHFDIKIVRSIECSKLNFFFKKDRNMQREEINGFYKAREDELRNIYESITVNDILKSESETFKPQDFNVNFVWQELVYDSFYKPNDILLIFNLDIICQVFRKGEQFEKINSELRNHMFELEKMWRSADSLSKKIEEENNSTKIKILSTIGKKDDFEGLIFPTQIFSDKMRFVRKQIKPRKDLINLLDKEIGFRMELFRKLLKKLKLKKINFMGFSRQKPTKLAIRLIATGFDFLEKGDLFIVAENATENFLEIFAYHYKKVIVFGLREGDVPKSYKFENYALASVEKIIEGYFGLETK